MVRGATARPSRAALKLNMFSGHLAPLWGKIVVIGPEAEADFSDARYWFKRVLLDDTGEAVDAELSFVEPESDDDLFLHDVATNLSELLSGGHSIETDGSVIVPVSIVRAHSGDESAFVFQT